MLSRAFKHLFFRKRLEKLCKLRLGFLGKRTKLEASLNKLEPPWKDKGMKS